MFAAALLAVAQFEIAAKTFLIDEPVPVVVTGLPPNSSVTLRAHNDEWASKVDFTADANGVVTPPDPMRLFWSAERTSRTTSHPEDWTLTAEVEGKVVATTDIKRLAVAPDVKITHVRDRGLFGDLYEPAGEGKHPAVLVLGGSGGGLPPASGAPGGLASRGYVVFSLAYFGEEGLPRALEYIPLEYFDKAVTWLMSQPSVDPTRVAILGTSRGGELALILGSIMPRIKAVIAYVPSDVVYAGCCDRRGIPAWTIRGRALALAPIQVENIHGAILLISGRDDGVWPSSRMSEEIVARLQRNHFAFPYKHLTYDHAGHGIGRPFTSTMEINATRHPLTGRIIRLGGTPEGTARARADSWSQMLDFLKANL